MEDVKEENLVQKLPKLEYTTPQGKTIIFNDQQVKVIFEIEDWLEDKTELLYTLSGYAGTGKSTLINYIISDIDKVVVSAPTHKAKILISKSTNKAGETIQKLLGLRPNTDLENFDVNNPKFDAIGKPFISDYKLVVIDEASMLNKDLLEMLIKEATQFNTKILFMGDEAQLPPVNEHKSKVFSIKNISYLTKVERQSSDNPLMKIYDSIRDNINTKDDVFEHKTMLLDNKGIVIYTNEDEFTEKALAAFTSTEFEKNKNYAKIIAYTNSSVKYWNSVVRDTLIGKGKRIVEPGDLLMSYSNIIVDKYNQIYNSADYKVISVQKTHNNFEIEVYSVLLQDIDNLEKYSVDFLILESHNIEKFKKIGNVLLAQAKGAFTPKQKNIAWAKYYSFKSHHCLMSPIGDISKDFDYGYAITVHKSQGSTYTNVFVDEADIDTNKKHAERNKLKYVAFSRPTDVVHCLNTTLPTPRKLNEHEVLMKNLWEKASNQQDTKEAILAIGRYLENNKLI